MYVFKNTHNIYKHIYVCAFFNSHYGIVVYIDFHALYLPVTMNFRDHFILTSQYLFHYLYLQNILNYIQIKYYLFQYLTLEATILKINVDCKSPQCFFFRLICLEELQK